MAKDNELPPPVPTVQPDWNQVRAKAEALLRANLFDPGSAQIAWDGGWRWGHTKEFKFFTKRIWGWLGCASLNAKNRYGGYVGAERYYVLLRQDGTMTAGSVNDVTSECDQINNTPLQAAFVDVAPTANDGSTSIADEIAKLAALRDRGIISPAEFDQQKAKLLAK